MPGSEPSSSTGKAEMKLIRGGRYLFEETKRSFDGMPFEGLGITGYDNMKKKFVAIWIDNVGTGVAVSEGTYDKSNRTFSYSMTLPDVITGKEKKARVRERIVSDDQWVAEIYDVAPDGKEFLTMKSSYERVKSSK